MEIAKSSKPEPSSKLACFILVKLGRVVVLMVSVAMCMETVFFVFSSVADCFANLSNQLLAIVS